MRNYNKEDIEMTVCADCHLHTSFSGDSTAPMEEMILKGIALGLTSMCFTEHMDMDFVYEQPSEEGMFDLNTDSYLYDFIKYKEKYSGQIQLLFGVELGIQAHLKRELALYSKREAVPFPYFCFGYRRILCFVSLRAFNANRSILLTFTFQREAVFFSYATQSAAYMNFVNAVKV